ncbi:MAG: alpha/beta hydrolase [Deltaproteobacteria bacterium]|nr:alpha/beta hydrolase [Deltaproteobacteria bacterium]
MEDPGKLSLKEKFIYRFILNEKRVYKHWYTRFLLCGLDLDRIRRVVSRIDNWYGWCAEWGREGDHVKRLAEDALARNDTVSAKCLFHEAAGCYHIGQHIFYVDYEQKNQGQEKVREMYEKAIALYSEDRRPVRVEIAFRNVTIPGYVWRTELKNRPLIILINGMDNLKEIEQHRFARILSNAGFNAFTFDGPGQGEMWERMTFIPDYHEAVSTIIDWLEENESTHMDLKRIGTLGFSLGGYLSPLAAGFDRRISCAIGNGGPSYLRLSPRNEALDPMKINPIWHRGFLYMTGKRTYKEAIEQFDIDIKKAPPMDRPLLIFHSGSDKVIPNGSAHADYFMAWAVGEKEVKFYSDGEHVCANYLDEVIPHTIDWFTKVLEP